MKFEACNTCGCYSGEHSPRILNTPTLDHFHCVAACGILRDIKCDCFIRVVDWSIRISRSELLYFCKISYENLRNPCS